MLKQEISSTIEYIDDTVHLLNERRERLVQMLYKIHQTSRNEMISALPEEEAPVVTTTTTTTEEVPSSSLILPKQYLLRSYSSNSSSKQLKRDLSINLDDIFDHDSEEDDSYEDESYEEEEEGGENKKLKTKKDYHPKFINMLIGNHTQALQDIFVSKQDNKRTDVLPLLKKTVKGVPTLSLYQRKELSIPRGVVTRINTGGDYGFSVKLFGKSITDSCIRMRDSGITTFQDPRDCAEVILAIQELFSNASEKFKQMVQDEKLR